jgi:ArsR family transcriptional regulator
MEDITQIYKALSEQMRLRILLLLTQGELCVCDIMAVLEEPQSKVSRHIAYLKNSGLVQGKRVGTWMHYHIKDDLDMLPAAHVEFLKQQLADLDWVRADLKKMKEVQEKKLCDAVAAAARYRPAARRSSKQSAKGETA